MVLWLGVLGVIRLAVFMHGSVFSLLVCSCTYGPWVNVELTEDFGVRTSFN